MSLSKEIVLSIGDYAMQLSGNLNFYVNDTLDLIFTLNKWGINNANSENDSEAFDLTGLSASLMIEDKNLSDHIEPLSIINNKITFRLTKKYTIMAGTGRMQIKLVDDDGCELKLPPFKYEIQNTINEWNDMNPTNELVLTNEDRSALLTSDGRLLLMSVSAIDNPNLVRINDLSEAKKVSYKDCLVVNADGVTKKIPVSLIKISSAEQMNIDKIPKMLSDINEIANKGTTTAIIIDATESEIRKQIDAGNLTHMVIGDGQITGSKISNNAIEDKHVERLSVVKLSEFDGIINTNPNLYVKDTMYEQGHWNMSGQFDNSATWYSSGYIEVEPSTIYTKTGARTDGGVFNSNIGEPVAFFDAQKRIIGMVTRDNTFTTPPDCKFINTLVAAPNKVFSDQRLNEYPYSHSREKMAIVKGPTLPAEYPGISASNYTLNGLKINSKNIKDHSIQSRHLSPDANLGVVHVGRTIPPSTAKLWFVPPVTSSGNKPGVNGFVSDGLVVYIDGRNGMMGDKIPNMGVTGEDLTAVAKNGATVRCDDTWYIMDAGASIGTPNMEISPNVFETEDITIMVRCKLPISLTSPIDQYTQAISLGSDPSWTGFYIKPFRSDALKWGIDCNPLTAITSQVGHADLKGSDVVLAMRKSNNVVELFLNGVKTGSSSHNNATIATWKANSATFKISMNVGSVGSALIYNRALSDEEMFLNVSLEEEIRGTLSPVIARDQSINNDVEACLDD